MYHGRKLYTEEEYYVRLETLGMTDPQNAIGAPKDADSGTKEILSPFFVPLSLRFVKRIFPLTLSLCLKSGLSISAPF
ncbi:hypothetical protein GCM10011497_37470 [Elstera cyanobacteriorum]|nr:hypothetical protein GCM10011497_37470 [Elstera cyanobacteriorum]